MAYLPGWVNFSDTTEEQRQDRRRPFEEAWEHVRHLHPADVSVTHGYAHNIVQLDHDKTVGLSDLEKLVLADSGNACFGGEVHGNVVKVYTD